MGCKFHFALREGLCDVDDASQDTVEAREPVGEGRGVVFVSTGHAVNRSRDWMMRLGAPGGSDRGGLTDARRL